MGGNSWTTILWQHLVQFFHVPPTQCSKALYMCTVYKAYAIFVYNIVQYMCAITSHLSLHKAAYIVCISLNKSILKVHYSIVLTCKCFSCFFIYWYVFWEDLHQLELVCSEVRVIAPVLATSAWNQGSFVTIYRNRCYETQVHFML